MTRRGLKLKEPQRRIRPIGDEQMLSFWQSSTSSKRKAASEQQRGERFFRLLLAWLAWKDGGQIAS